MKQSKLELIRYYKGLIRDLNSRCVNLESMANKMEKDIKALLKVTLQSPSNLKVFSDFDNRVNS